MPRNEVDLVSLKNRYGIVGTDPAFEDALRMAVRVAPTDFPVLIIGETGAGKENIARIIHDYSDRRRNAYQTIDCGSTPEGTIESELFGHKKGSFTDVLLAFENQFFAVVTCDFQCVVNVGVCAVVLKADIDNRTYNLGDFTFDFL